MRVSFICTAAALLASIPAWAQSTSQVVGPKTTLPAHVMCADLPVMTLPAPALVVKGGHAVDRRLSMARGDAIVLGRTADDGLGVGQRYIVRRLPTRTAPHSSMDAGFIAVKTAGFVTVTALDEVNALAEVDFSCDSVEPGDYLEPFVEPVLPTSGAAMMAPDFSDRVPILPGVDGRRLFANGDTFSIARGADHGLVAGARYAIYRDRKDGGPLVHIGEAIVADAAMLTAKVLLVTTADVVETDDIAVPRRAQQ